MSRRRIKSSFHGLLILIPLALVALFFFLSSDDRPEPEEKSGDRVSRSPLAELSRRPDWTKLKRFQNTLSLETFRSRLETIYTRDDSWKTWITLDERARQADLGDLTLAFADEDQPAPAAHYRWKRRSDLAPGRGLPLAGLKIALDPGHIGGKYAALEEREYRFGDTVIQEGTMTLRTAKVLAPLLEKRGASVTLVRSTLEPVTGKRADDFPDPRLFYRTAEIRERARLINDFIQPDLVICLHYNGSASKIPELSQHFHLILNGTYTAGELAHEDERFEMLQRLLSGTITEEIPLAREVAGAFNDLTSLPPYRYPENSPTSQNLDHHPNLWGRNLLANRLYQCPVIFLEPYVMNSLPFLARYRRDPEEIYQEYARAVAEGLARYYSHP